MRAKPEITMATNSILAALILQQQYGAENGFGEVEIRGGKT